MLEYSRFHGAGNLADIRKIYQHAGPCGAPLPVLRFRNLLLENLFDFQPEQAGYAERQG